MSLAEATAATASSSQQAVKTTRIIKTSQRNSHQVKDAHRVENAVMRSDSPAGFGDGEAEGPQRRKMGEAGLGQDSSAAADLRMSLQGEHAMGGAADGLARALQNGQFLALDVDFQEHISGE